MKTLLNALLMVTSLPAALSTPTPVPVPASSPNVTASEGQLAAPPVGPLSYCLLEWQLTLDVYDDEYWVAAETANAFYNGSWKSTPALRMSPTSSHVLLMGGEIRITFDHYFGWDNKTFGGIFYYDIKLYEGISIDTNDLDGRKQNWLKLDQDNLDITIYNEDEGGDYVHLSGNITQTCSPDDF